MAYTESNAKDIIACGFNPKKTFVFSSLKYETYTRPIVAQVNKKMSVHVTNKIYGFKEDNNLGQLSWAPLQIAPAYCGAFPHLFGDKKDVMCLVALAVDQAVYFRSARDYAEDLGYPKPAMVCGKFLVGLQGVGEKLSSTGEIPAIFLNDPRKAIETKIKKYAFSGGRETLEEHRRLGANLQVDVPYIYLFHFMEDETELQRIAEEYRTGRMLTSEIKKILVDVLERMLNKHQADRAAITPELYKYMFMMRVQPAVKDAFMRFREKYIQADPQFE
jgi:tryptophanyl-tRNA synthetase